MDVLHTATGFALADANYRLNMWLFGGCGPRPAAAAAAARRGRRGSKAIMAAGPRPMGKTGRRPRRAGGGGAAGRSWLLGRGRWAKLGGGRGAQGEAGQQGDHGCWAAADGQNW